MALTIILIRHAQAEHNVSNEYNIPDPPLTSRGLDEQCPELARILQEDLTLAQKIELIVVSPLQRTVQTAHKALGWLKERGVPVMLRAEWQENSTKPCDTGSTIEVMQKRWPQFDWSSIDPIFPAKTGLYEWSKKGLENRAIEARRWLRKRPEKVIAVVSHAGFLSHAVSHKHYANADFRIFEFAEGHDDIGGELVEWELTESKGGGRGESYKGEVLLEDEQFEPPNPADNAPTEFPKEE